MTRKSLAETLYEDTEGTPEEPGQQWLLLYDFKGIKPGTKFYTNLARLSALKGETRPIQYSALHTTSMRVILAAKKLATHYGAKTIAFKVKETDP